MNTKRLSPLILIAVAAVSVLLTGCGSDYIDHSDPANMARNKRTSGGVPINQQAAAQNIAGQ